MAVGNGVTANGASGLLVDSLPGFDHPWQRYTLGQEKFNQEKKTPLEEYFKHLQNRYAGEVALVCEKWDEFGEGASAVGDVPRNMRLWDQQFARNREQARAMDRLPFTGWGRCKMGTCGGPR